VIAGARSMKGEESVLVMWWLTAAG